MGKTVSNVVNAVVEPAKQVVSGVGEIASGDVGKGLGDIGKGAVNTAKGLYLDAPKALVTTPLGELKNNPGAAIADGITIAGSAGLGLPSLGSGLDLGSVGQSVLSGLQGLNPGQLANKSSGGTPTQAAAAAPVLPQSSSMLPILLIGAGLFAVILLRRR